MSQMGIPYEKMEEAGIISPVLTVSCQYRQMTHFGETVEIIPSIKSYNGIRLVISYLVRNKETGEVAADGETSHCFLNRDGKIVSLKKALPETHEVFMAYTENGK